MTRTQTVRPLLRLLRSRPWALPATIVLGLLASLAEGLGLSMFLPLLQSLEHSGELGPAAAQVPERLTFLLDFARGLTPWKNPLLAIIALILSLTVFKSVMRYLFSLVSGRLNADITHELRARVFRGLLATSQETRDRVGTGRLINLLANDTWHTSDAIALLSSLMINSCFILVYSILLVTLSWKLSAIVLAGVIVISLLLRVVSMRAKHWGREGVVANALLSEKMLDAMEGIREIQTFRLQHHLRTKFEPVSRRVRSIFFRLGLLHAASGPISEILYVSLILGILFMEAQTGGSISTVLVFLLVLYRMQPQIREIDTSRLGLASLASSVEAVTEFLSEQPGEQVLDRSAHHSSHRFFSPAPSKLDRATEIEFDRISFTYPGASEPALSDVSFRIPACQITGIVGHSGSGKSTLAGLLCRLWEPASGTLRWNGHDAAQLDPDTWRDQIAWVDQGAHLFNATVAENIRYGRLDATDEEVVAAARDADADSFIAELPLGYETRIGTGGVQLSSGQAQRIALARVFLRKPSLVILDEATNGLDSLSEDWIQTGLRRMAETAAVVVISHRIPSVQFANQVIVFEHGRVVEQGSPQQLRRRAGFFSKVYELQHAD